MSDPDNEAMRSAMPWTFEDREQAFEAQFARQEEQRFLALARRDKLFALWLVGQLGATGPARQKLLHDLLTVQGFPHHDAALLAAAAGICAEAGQPAAMQHAAETLERLGIEALEQVMRGGTTPIDLSAPA